MERLYDALDISAGSIDLRRLAANQIFIGIKLGLRKINAEREHDDNSVIRGMITKVAHLVEVTQK